ncbi:MAG: hypothetical protein QM751_05510 [Paludibacteraceae bacterium]
MRTFHLILVFIFSSSLAIFGQFSLPSLNYSYKSLEPYIDSTTMRIHYSAHHAAYVTNLNKALEKYPNLQKKELTYLLENINTLPKEIQTSVRNNGGGHYNHSLFLEFIDSRRKLDDNTRSRKIAD